MVIWVHDWHRWIKIYPNSWDRRCFPWNSWKILNLPTEVGVWTGLNVGWSQACLLWLTHSRQSDNSLFFFNVQVANGNAKGISSGPPLGCISMYIELKRDCIFQENRIAVTISPQCLHFRYYPLLWTWRVSRWMNAVYLQIAYRSARVLHVSGPRQIEQTDVGVIFQWKGAKI